MHTWRYLDASGGDAGRSEPFDRREDAEAWMGEAWEQLLERGIESVELLDGERRLYRMGLGPA